MACMSSNRFGYISRNVELNLLRVGCTFLLRKLRELLRQSRQEHVMHAHILSLLTCMANSHCGSDGDAGEGCARV